jgi:hypothetical protein
MIVELVKVTIPPLLIFIIKLSSTIYVPVGKLKGDVIVILGPKKITGPQGDVCAFTFW